MKTKASLNEIVRLVRAMENASGFSTQSAQVRQALLTAWAAYLMERVEIRSDAAPGNIDEP
jgi:hypothetical protein